MVIQQIFDKDINRPINGVVKVGQDEEKIVAQEVSEYVITKELRKHFIAFFDTYSKSFTAPINDTCVWVSGFFGSGKSHFVKMLSYLLSNREINSDGHKKHVVEYFREKFDDEATFLKIDASTKNGTETILFNIDVEGSIRKDSTAVLRVFAKVFYNHLGFWGENLKVARLEQYIARKGKLAEFHRVFEEKNGDTWLNVRRDYDFFEDDVVATLEEVLGMSNQAATNWFNGEQEGDLSIAQLVSDMKEYVDSKPKDFRLIFIADEVGQYIGDNKDRLLNLQSFAEEFCGRCQDKVWLICTGQEAMDEVIKVRNDEFSRIQGRFKTRLSLSSSSADEVIQKRVLKKKDEYIPQLEAAFSKNDSVLRNLFSFTEECVKDIKGYTGPRDFVDNYPFVPYQFIILQKVFTEIRKHGNAGKHLAGGERSMLSGFQEAAQRLQEKDENAVVPFYLFYDTVYTFLDSSIRKVIDRCQNAADNNYGLLPQDVDTLKLLYLIRYIDDIKPCIENIAILMCDDIRTDKIAKRQEIGESLDRLVSQNYVGRTGDVYNFLTDEEQDIAKEIDSQNVDSAAIVEAVGRIIYDDIFTTKKYKHNKYDFPLDRYIDSQMVGQSSGGMAIQVLTMGTYATEKDDGKLILASHERAIIRLPETSYYEAIATVLKIKKYGKQHNVSQLSEIRQSIIKGYYAKAEQLQEEAKEDLKAAIVKADYFIAGERVQIKGSEAKDKMNEALGILLGNVYTALNEIDTFYDNDDEIRNELRNTPMPGMEHNKDAAKRIEEYLEIQFNRKLKTHMSDIQSHFQTKPMGWRESEIAGVVACLVRDQKATIKYAGTTIHLDNPKLIDLLRKKSETGKTVISKRQLISAKNMKDAGDFLRQFFKAMSIPADEDGLVQAACDRFKELKERYDKFLAKYAGNKKYPEKSVVSGAVSLLADIINKQSDNEAFITNLLKKRDDLLDMSEDMENLENFFGNQIAVFDAAEKMLADLQYDNAQIEANETANEAIKAIRVIMLKADSKQIYREIPKLNNLMTELQNEHNAMLEEKRKELRDVISQCREAIHAAAEKNEKANMYISAAADFYNKAGTDINQCKGLTLLDGKSAQYQDYMDKKIQQIKQAIKPPAPKKPQTPKPAGAAAAPKPAKKVRTVMRAAIVEKETLSSVEEIDAYLAVVRQRLIKQLEGYDMIKLN